MVKTSSSLLVFAFALQPLDVQAWISFQPFRLSLVFLTWFSGLCVDRPDSYFLFLFSLLVWARPSLTPPQPSSAQLLHLCFFLHWLQEAYPPRQQKLLSPLSHLGYGLVQQNK